MHCGAKAIHKGCKNDVLSESTWLCYECLEIEAKKNEDKSKESNNFLHETIIRRLSIE